MSRIEITTDDKTISCREVSMNDEGVKRACIEFCHREYTDIDSVVTIRADGYGGLNLLFVKK